MTLPSQTTETTTTPPVRQRDRSKKRFVILRDDDTNALMPTECLERLYRPFLKRRFPVNLAVIPSVAVNAVYQPGRPEGFLMQKTTRSSGCIPIGCNRELIDYLAANPLFKVVQHGCCHDRVCGRYEFDHDDRNEIARRLDGGMQLLKDAGLGSPKTFVAPYDQLSRPSLEEVSRRFSVLSTGWYELRRIPPGWWPQYAWKKATGAPHWRAGGLTLLSHPGCQLSYHRSYSLILQAIEEIVQSQRLTVLVTHWWEYFRNGKPDDAFIEVLHQTAEYLAAQPNVEVISFDALTELKPPLN